MPDDQSPDTGLSKDTMLIVAAIAITGIVVAVIGTVLGNQIVHKSTEFRHLAARIDEQRDALCASVVAEIQALRDELAAGGDADVVDQVGMLRRLDERLHNIEHELSEVEQSVVGLRSDTAKTQPLSQRLQSIHDELEKMNQSVQNANRSASAATHPLDGRLRAMQDVLDNISRIVERQRHRHR